MSNSDEHNYRGRELRNVAEVSDKNRGCCTKHPVLCCCALVVTLIIAIVAGALVGAFVATIEAKVDDAIGEVCQSAMVYCAVAWFHLLIPSLPCMAHVMLYTGKDGCVFIIV